jgi:probable addiction module antidote protein
MMISIERDTTPWDSAEYLQSEEDQAANLTAVLEEDDPELFAHALGGIARARGMTQVAKEAGLGRANLYKSLGGGAKPEIGTVMRVLRALGIKLFATPLSRVGRLQDEED